MKDLFLRPVDVPKLLLCVVAAAALFAATLIAAERVPYRDKRVSGPNIPYSFNYPADWKQDHPLDLPEGARRTVGYLAAVSKNEGGVLVGAFNPAPRDQLIRAVKAQYAQFGGIARPEKSVSVQGFRGLEFQADSSDGTLHDRTTVLFVDEVAYWIQCVAAGASKKETEDACDKVLQTFRITNPGVLPEELPSTPGPGLFA